MTEYESTMVSREDVTSLLIQWGEGDSTALDRLVPLVYDELRRIARAHLRTERTGHTLQPTALVNEAYLRLMNLDRLTFAGRARFLAVAARVMRQVLVDLPARAKSTNDGVALGA